MKLEDPKRNERIHANARSVRTIRLLTDLWVVGCVIAKPKSRMRSDKQIIECAWALIRITCRTMSNHSPPRKSPAAPDSVDSPLTLAFLLGFKCSFIWVFKSFADDSFSKYKNSVEYIVDTNLKSAVFSLFRSRRESKISKSMSEGENISCCPKPDSVEN